MKTNEDGLTLEEEDFLNRISQEYRSVSGGGIPRLIRVIYLEGKKAGILHADKILKEVSERHTRKTTGAGILIN